ncbi:hypothetical protein [Methylobacterium planeticum]|uniref:Uncharacterized protein n=1 Tax=Methylobacterium planeticum TaxID=2615211 RepID=A0A6N6MS27_9HYPH|nr:hypothetical protein [Methylobacterium planeticum]KAB1074347.1 hypothetical protein F6X51_08215 [Methylobacterium planeticum]
MTGLADAANPPGPSASRREARAPAPVEPAALDPRGRCLISAKDLREIPAAGPGTRARRSGNIQLS